jgi:hypothetical protein
MPPKDEFASVMDDALKLINQVAVFYAKFHILPFEERAELQQRLRYAYDQWTRCSAFEQQHVDFIVVLARELRLHYDEWIQDDHLRRKRWRRHPGEEVEHIINDSVNLTAHIEGAIIHAARRLSGVHVKEEAWN